MKKYKIVLLICIFTANPVIFGQQNSTLETINKQIWQNFSQAFQNLDYDLFESLHHPDFVRINGNADIIKIKSEYLQQYRDNWKGSSAKLDIQFRFLERIYSENNASERGIYKMTINPGTDLAQFVYGKFHVIMRQTDGKWQLLMDYDSDENATIGEPEFHKALKMNNFENF